MYKDILNEYYHSENAKTFLNESYRDEDHWVSPYNFIHQVTDGYSIADKVTIHDCTLRDGEQTPGVVFTKEDKIAIAKKLSDIGVDRIEAGMPVVSKDDYDAIKEINRLCLPAKTVAFCRGNVKDVEVAAECGVKAVVVEVPVGETRYKWQFSKWTTEDMYAKTLMPIKLAKKLGMEVIFFPYETTRGNPDFIQEFLYTVHKQTNFDSTAVIDTLGVATPGAIHYLVKMFKDLLPVPIEIHTHNDFGMGVANTLAAVEAGASCVHTSVNGLGERTGNAPIDEVVAAMKYLYNIPTPVDCSQLVALSNLVAKCSNRTVDDHKPITGAATYTREIGAGIGLMDTAPLAIFPFRPEVFGNRSGVMIGKKSGSESIRIKMKQYGMPELSDEDTKSILNDVKEYGITYKKCLSDDELKTIINKRLPQ